MKTKMILLEIPVGCGLCCEDCDFEDCETGPVIKGDAIEVPVPVGHVFSVVFETGGENTDWTATKLYAVKEPTK